MALDDLKPILEKEEVIATFPAEMLARNPQNVEVVYRTHALTHMPLGETEKHLDTIWKWIGGDNKGAFIGAVLGNYGEGKTSFQVHVWEKCYGRNVLAVPPFSWHKVADMIDGVAAWLDFRLQSQNPAIAKKVERLHEEFREQSLQELAARVAKETGRDVDEIYTTLRATQESGGGVDTGVSSDRFLEYLEAATLLAQEAGFAGVLVLLDEPEVAARSLGEARVSQILFELANGLLQRQGDFGLFISMPENFYSNAQRMFTSLPARLQARGCFPRLRDSYGDDFAPDLWQRYLKEYKVSAAEAAKIAPPETLKAIGQVASSARMDLSYGPRTVITALRRLVARYDGVSAPYAPADFVRDALDQEISVTPDYRTRVQDTLRLPSVSDDDRETVLTLAAFPNGLNKAQAEALGVREPVEELARRGGLVYRSGQAWGLSSLRPKGAGGEEGDELADAIRTIMGEFRPAASVWTTARQAFIDHVVPLLFKAKQGQQLLGWERTGNWRDLKHAAGAFRIAEFAGAFNQTAKDFPRRNVALAISDEKSESAPLAQMFSTDDPLTDAVWHFTVRWNPDNLLPSRRIEVFKGDVGRAIPHVVRVAFDWAGEPLSHERLEEFVDPQTLTPLGVLHLLGEMDKRTLAQDLASEWKATADQLLRALIERMGEEMTASLMAARDGKTEVRPMPFFDRIGFNTLAILKNRYPNYSTLIRSPQWDSKINEYVRVLNQAGIPLAAKRGRQVWSAPTGDVSRVFNISAMNLSDSFNGFETLLAIKKQGRDEAQVEFKIHPLEAEIMQRIENSSKKVELNNKECTYLRLDELLGVLRFSGYQLAEIVQIVEIGKARGTFKAGENKNKKILYCPPLDPDQMRARRRDQLEELKVLFAAAETLPDYQPPLDVAVAEAEIEKVGDEAADDSLRLKFEGALAKHLMQVNTHFDRLATAFADARREAGDIKNGFERSREVAGLQTAPSGQSRWVADLSKYILQNLNEEKKKIVDAADKVAMNSTKREEECGKTRNAAPFKRTEEGAQGWLLASTLKDEVSNLKSRAQTMLNQVREYEEWRRLIVSSDSVYTQLMSLQKEPAHKAKADELMADLEKIWNDISDHLSVRNLGGLDAHKQFAARLQSLDEARRTYLGQLRAAFQKQKEAAETLLRDLQLMDARVEAPFEEANVEGSYSRLYGGAASRVEAALKAEASDLKAQKGETQYARDILRRLTDKKSAPLLEKLDAATTSVQDALAHVSPEAWSEAIGVGATAPTVTATKAALAQAREALREAKNVTRDALGKTEVELTENAQQMGNLLPVNGTVDLKELVLQMMEQGHSPAQALEVSLESLGDLFRAGRAQIRVERPRR